MKKIATIFLCMILIMSISGCKKTELSGEYEARVFSYSDSGSGARIEREYESFDRDKVDDSNVNQTITLSVNGLECKATYQNDFYTNVCHQFPEYVYKDENNCMLTVDPEGNLISYLWELTENTEGTKPKLSEKECLEVAKNFVSTVIDLKNYRIETEYKASQGRYVFKFIKYIGDQATADRAYVYVLDTGELDSFDSTMLGKIPMDTEFDFDMKKVEQTLYDRLNTIYSDAKESFDEVEYELSDSFATILEDGTAAIIAYFDVHCVNQVGENFISRGGRVGFIVMKS